MTQALHADCLILGGGIAGLWLLDELQRAGYHALLLERHHLGGGQTIASQGIIHGGLKYTLKGRLTGSAKAIRDAPQLWRDCLEGRGPVDLTNTTIRSDFCYLWRTRSLKSMLGAIGAKQGLRIAPQTISPQDRPNVLAQCPGDVMQLSEQVIDPVTLIADLAQQHQPRIARYQTIHFARDESQQVCAVTIDEKLTVQTASLILTAGRGNAELREQLNLDPLAMQKRPLHMVMLRGKDLPALNGHCVDGNATRMTITTAKHNDQTVWQLGGQIAEHGVTLSRDDLIAQAKKEITEVLPRFDASGLTWATYRVDRAEARTAGLLRPTEATVLQDANVLTAWPTKLVMAPHLAQKIIALLPPASNHDPAAWPNDWPKPAVAPPPWEVETWT